METVLLETPLVQKRIGEDDSVGKHEQQYPRTGRTDRMHF